MASPGLPVKKPAFDPLDYMLARLCEG